MRMSLPFIAFSDEGMSERRLDFASQSSSYFLASRHESLITGA